MLRNSPPGMALTLVPCCARKDRARFKRRWSIAEVVLIRIEFHLTPGGSLRPGAVLLDSGDDDFVAAPITSHLRTSGFDVSIHHWREAGLKTCSTVRLKSCDASVNSPKPSAARLPLVS